MFLAKIHFKIHLTLVLKISNNSYFFSPFCWPTFLLRYGYIFTHLILTITTLGIGQFLCCIFKDSLTDEYLSKGWQWVDERGKAIPKQN